jgi:hypothetical protein
MDRALIFGTLITYQCVVLDYPLEAAVRSCLDLCDYVYINDGKSKDGTLDILYSLQKNVGKERLKVFEKTWIHDRSFWTKEKNFVIDMVPSEHYVLAIDADEVFHEKDIEWIKNLVNRGVKSLSFPFIHFYGRPTHYIEGPVWYKRHTRLWKKDTGIHLIHRHSGCADDVVWPDGYPAHWGRFIDARVPIYHYGNCRHPRALGIKSKKADDLYQNSMQYIDGSLPQERSFNYAFDEALLIEFKRTHPKYIKEWVENHKSQHTKYDIGDSSDNKLWCFEE